MRGEVVVGELVTVFCCSAGLWTVVFWKFVGTMCSQSVMGRKCLRVKSFVFFSFVWERCVHKFSFPGLGLLRGRLLEAGAHLVVIHEVDGVVVDGFDFEVKVVAAVCTVSGRDASVSPAA